MMELSDFFSIFIYNVEILYKNYVFLLHFPTGNIFYRNTIV